MSTSTDHRMTAPDVMGMQEVRTLLNVSWPQLHRLIDEDPAFPMARRLKIGHIWSGEAIRAYDTDRRRMGVYLP